MNKKTTMITFAATVALLSFTCAAVAKAETATGGPGPGVLPATGELVVSFLRSAGLLSFIFPASGNWIDGIGRLAMIAIGVVLLYLAIRKKFEPLLLVPIGFGAILSNIPLAGMNDPGGVLYYLYTVGIKTGIFPLLACSRSARVVSLVCLVRGSQFWPVLTVT